MAVSAEELAICTRMHVQRFWLAHVFFPFGEKRYHFGIGTLDVAGETWEGLSDPDGSQLVGLDGMEEPRFGQAVAVRALFSGANRTFLKQVWDYAETMEGARCDLWWGVMDAETGEVLIAPKRRMRGKLTVPKLSIVGTSVRLIEIPIVSRWEGLNFPTVESEWSPTGQRRRHPGDKGLDLIGSNVVEVYLD